MGLSSVHISHRQLLFGHPLGETDLGKSLMQVLEAAQGHLGGEFGAPVSTEHDLGSVRQGVGCRQGCPIGPIDCALWDGLQPEEAQSRVL